MDLGLDLTAFPGLRLLVLFGSRATGTSHVASDWDFGYLADDGFDPETLQPELTRILATDAVDLVDLARASAVLRRDAAVDGQLVWELADGTFEDFQIEAATFWCDTEPVFREAFADVLRAAAG